MEPEIPTEANGSKKKFLIIALAGILVVAGALGYLFMQKDTLLPQEEGSLLIKTQTQIEKEKQIAQMVQAIPKSTMTQTERNQLVKSIPKKTTLSSEEQTKLLQSIPPSVIQ